MKFINRTGEPIKIRVGKLGNYHWITVGKNEIVKLSRRIGKNNGLEELKTTEGQIGDKKVETKQIETDRPTDKITDVYTPDDLFFKELTKIDGIGPKTAKDIVVYGTKEKLIEVIELRGSLPFRDDIVEKLRSKYGK